MSPYVSLDPAAKYSFAGPSAGPGASIAWSGNSKVGEGRMTINGMTVAAARSGPAGS